MKQMKTWMSAAILTICSTSVIAQDVQYQEYLQSNEYPNALRFMPLPPTFDSIRYADDLIQWEWGKTQRDTPRGQQASREELRTPDIMRIVIAEALSIDTISDTTTPALARLLQRAYYTGNACVKGQKKQYFRIRPFMQMGEDTWGAYDDDFLRTNSSFPSGHTAFGWFTAMVFAEMFPQLQDTIMRRGFQFGENRVISGAHYQSDVYTGYLSAAASFARAHANPELREDILAARAEYISLKGYPADYNVMDGVDIPHGENILNMPVTADSYRFVGDLMRYWQARNLRTTERGEQARCDAPYTIENIEGTMGDVMEMEISETATPAIHALMAYVLEKSSNTADHMKPLRFRTRPFVQLGDNTLFPDDEEKEKGKSSYPSGHTCLGWSEALTLIEVAPELQDTILHRGFQFGESRQIAGYHWASDIEAGRLLASTLMTYLHNDATFLDLLAKARTEYQAKTTGIAPVASRQATNAEGTYTLGGLRLSGKPSGKGIYISNGSKYLNTGNTRP